MNNLVLRARRRRGYAIWLLEQGLERLSAEGNGRALITGTDTNFGSQSVIQRCGDTLDNTVLDDAATMMCRYWFTSQDRPR